MNTLPSTGRLRNSVAVVKARTEQKQLGKAILQQAPKAAKLLFLSLPSILGSLHSAYTRKSYFK